MAKKLNKKQTKWLQEQVDYALLKLEEDFAGTYTATLANQRMTLWDFALDICQYFEEVE